MNARRRKPIFYRPYKNVVGKLSRSYKLTKLRSDRFPVLALYLSKAMRIFLAPFDSPPRFGICNDCLGQFDDKDGRKL